MRIVVTTANFPAYLILKFPVTITTKPYLFIATLFSFNLTNNTPSGFREFRLLSSHKKQIVIVLQLTLHKLLNKIWRQICVIIYCTYMHYRKSCIIHTAVDIHKRIVYE